MGITIFASGKIDSIDELPRLIDPKLLAEKRVELGRCLRHVEKVIGSIELSDADARDAESIASKIEQALLKEKEQND